MFLFMWSRTIADSIGWAGVQGTVGESSCETWSRGDGNWGLYGRGGEKRAGARCWWEGDGWRVSVVWSGHVLREKKAAANEREDGRTGWLINLFTSPKTLRAPFWLKFSLSSIIAIAGLNHFEVPTPNTIKTIKPPNWAPYHTKGKIK